MKIGYRTHKDFVDAWQILRELVWHPEIDTAPQCPVCHRLVFEQHAKDCLIYRGQTLVVDHPSKGQ